MKDPSSRRAEPAKETQTTPCKGRSNEQITRALREVEGGRESHRGLSLVGDLALARHILQEIVRNKL